MARFAHDTATRAGEASRRHGNTLIRTLRKTYGPSFAKDCDAGEKLSDVLAKLDKPSLFKLVRDYEAGMLPIRLKSSAYLRCLSVVDESDNLAPS
jgi:hypothetical protein